MGSSGLRCGSRSIVGWALARRGLGFTDVGLKPNLRLHLNPVEPKNANGPRGGVLVATNPALRWGELDGVFTAELKRAGPIGDICRVATLRW